MNFCINMKTFRKKNIYMYIFEKNTIFNHVREEHKQNTDDIL